MTRTTTRRSEAISRGRYRSKPIGQDRVPWTSAAWKMLEMLDMLDVEMMNTIMDTKAKSMDIMDSKEAVSRE